MMDSDDGADDVKLTNIFWTDSRGVNRFSNIFCFEESISIFFWEKPLGSREYTTNKWTQLTMLHNNPRNFYTWTKHNFDKYYFRTSVKRNPWIGLETGCLVGKGVIGFWYFSVCLSHLLRIHNSRKQRQ